MHTSHQPPYRATHPVMAKTTILKESEKQNHVLGLLKTLPLTFDLRPFTFTFKGSQIVLLVFQALAKADVFAHVSM